MPHISVSEDDAQAEQTLGENQTQLGHLHFQLPIRRPPTQSSNTATGTQSLDIVSAESWDLSTPLYKALDEDVEQLDITDLAFQRLARGDIELLDATLNAGADIERQNRDGLTMLVTAIKDSNVPITELLLLQGADPQHCAHGKPPLFHAVESRNHGPQLIRLLLDFGVDITTTSGPSTMNALHWAAASGMVDAADYLLSRGIEIEATCIGEHTALHVAAGTGHLIVVQLLLAQGAELSKRGELEDNALTLASSMGYLDIVELLIDEGLIVDSLDKTRNDV
ncbi:hypothetical protein E8E12_006160 [Didymella heteroderae]|uniref:Ankyrin n=1 Tax=Didymella heteroderae TaxID=1769908 RepID=A0A9P4WKN5_9PLEO|nr:hypothetical protein E8E12_006160 [Didymella heteroderae]